MQSSRSIITTTSHIQRSTDIQIRQKFLRRLGFRSVEEEKGKNYGNRGRNFQHQYYNLDKTVAATKPLSYHKSSASTLASSLKKGATREPLKFNNETDRQRSNSYPRGMIPTVVCSRCDDEERSSEGCGGTPSTDPTMEGTDRSAANSKIRFDSMVTVISIPSHTQYSDRMKRLLWTPEQEGRMNRQRNMREFASEDFDWKQCVEEDQMYHDTRSNEFILETLHSSHRADYKDSFMSNTY